MGPMPTLVDMVARAFPIVTVVTLLALSFGYCNTPDGREFDEHIPSSQPVPTPLKAVALGMAKDPKIWKVGHGAGNQASILLEMVPEGEEVASWNELSTNIVLFGVPVAGYVEQWKDRLRSAGATISEEETLPDGSIWVAYSSSSENGMWRYLQGPDGVYGASYQTRPSTEDPERVNIWREILREASLQPNPNAPGQPSAAP